MFPKFGPFVRKFSSKDCSKSCKPKTTLECKKPKGVPEYKLQPGECIYGPSGYYPHPQGGYKIYKNISLFVCLPLCILLYVSIFSHEHPPRRPPYVQYEYWNKITKKYPWGSDLSLFFNPELNSIPGVGYEDQEGGKGGEEEEEEEE